MSNFLQADLPSEDEADEDFNPDLGNEEVPTCETQDGRDGSLAAGGDRKETTHAKAARKERVDAIWEQLQAKSGVKPKRPRIEQPADQSTLAQEEQQQQPEEDAVAAKAARARKAAAAALAATRAAAAASAGMQYGMPRVTETRKFAGQQVTVTRTARPGEAAEGAAAGAQKPAPIGGAPTGPAGPPKPTQLAGGLDAALASLAEPKRINVLDKTRSDWSEFKADNEAVDAELEAHKRSAGQYLDKQAFLQAAELREYEAERDKRMRGR